MISYAHWLACKYLDTCYYREPSRLPFNTYTT